MKRAIQTYWRFFAAIIGLAIIAAIVGGYILSNQRFYLPGWVPGVGSDFIEYETELPTAQSITPGQGQTVNVAGVPVGEISAVDLEEGRAIVTMKIRRKYTPIFQDATILVRPKTGLNDMVLELTPGSRSSGELDPDSRIPVKQTLSNVNLDELLASLDTNTRDYLKLLLAGGAEGLENNSVQLAAAFRRFQPVTADLKTIMSSLEQRRDNIRRTMRNFRLLSETLAEKDDELASLIDASSAVFDSFAKQDANLRRAIRDLPSALESTNTALGKADELGDVLGPTMEALRPTARALGPTLRQVRPFLRETTPIVRDQLRPFARDTLPVIKDLRPAARDLAQVIPDLDRSFKVLNELVNVLAYDKKGDGDESYLFYVAWANHLGNALFTNADAHGPIRRGIVYIGCSSLGLLDALARQNGQLGLLQTLLDAPKQEEVCSTTNQAGEGTPSTRSAPAAGSDMPVLANVPQQPATTEAGR